MACTHAVGFWCCLKCSGICVIICIRIKFLTSNKIKKKIQNFIRNCFYFRHYSHDTIFPCVFLVSLFHSIIFLWKKNTIIFIHSILHSFNSSWFSAQAFDPSQKLLNPFHLPAPPIVSCLLQHHYHSPPPSPQSTLLTPTYSPCLLLISPPYLLLLILTTFTFPSSLLPCLCLFFLMSISLLPFTSLPLILPLLPPPSSSSFSSRPSCLLVDYLTFGSRQCIVSC